MPIIRLVILYNLHSERSEQWINDQPVLRVREAFRDITLSPNNDESFIPYRFFYLSVNHCILQTLVLEMNRCLLLFDNNQLFPNISYPTCFSKQTTNPTLVLRLQVPH